MVELKIKVVDDLKQSRIELEGFPQGVEGRVERYEGQTLEPPKGGQVLLLTEDAELAREARRHEHMRVVYVGDPSQMAGGLILVDDIWNPSDGEALLGQRYTRLVNSLKTQAEAECYRDAVAEAVAAAPELYPFKALYGEDFALVNGKLRETTGHIPTAG